MDHYQYIQMKYNEDATLVKMFVEMDKIYDFLDRLNIEFNAIRI